MGETDQITELTGHIDRVEAPTREEFTERWVRTNTPVILTGVGSRWPAFTRWSPQYFVEHAGDSEVTVHFDEDGNFFRWYQTGKGRVDRVMKVRELMEILTREPAEHRYYVTEHEVRFISEVLCKDLDYSRYLDAQDTDPLIFIGRDTFMPLHYHGTTEALLCQVVGSKTVTLYSPDQFGLLSARPWYGNAPLFSRIDPRDAQARELFPRFKDAEPLTFKLHAGEILFIPVHWWHVTKCPGFQLNVTCFWTASLKQYTYPEPALQVFAREALWQGKQRWKRLKQRLSAGSS
jgi:jumonji domain-containing protein 7